MSLEPGVRLGPYEVASLLGSGGMGEVYRARDTRLGRDVAIKVLPSGFSTDADRVWRFEQEARTAGMLNHPNILAIYDIGTHDQTEYVVSELLEGRTLRHAIADGPLPLRKSLDFGLQIATGLAAAHAKGIVHRDLKPENLFITLDGRVKILDFGLAKLTQGDGSGNGQTDLQTSPAGTEPGMVMGTVGYMSPEQVRGQPVDSRADIFSFGAILYEMLAGRRAFQRETPVETMTAILKDELPDFGEVDAKVPPVVQRIVRRCLEKAQAARFQTASDLAFALEAISGVSSAMTGRTTTIAPVRKARWTMTALALAALALLGGALWAVRRSGVQEGETTARASQPLFRPVTFRRGNVAAARFSTDGQTIVYAAAWDGGPLEVFTTRRDSAESKPLGVPSGSILAVSSTGELALSLGCARNPGLGGCEGTLARMPLAGGAPREIAQRVSQADWSPDGTQLAIVRRTDANAFRLECPIGRVLYEVRAPETIGAIRFSRDGRLIAFVDGLEHSISVVDLAGKKTTLIPSIGQIVVGMNWSADGREIWFSRNLPNHPLAIVAVTLSGEQRIVERVPGYITVLDVSRDGQVLATSGVARFLRMMGLAPGETRERDLAWLSDPNPAGLSADGRLLLFDALSLGSPGNGVYVRRTDGSQPVRLAEGWNDAFALSADGRWAAMSTSDPPWHVVIASIGAGETRQLPPGPLEDLARPVRWFPDGRRLLFAGRERGRDWRSYVQDVDGGLPRAVTPEGVRGVLVDADGKSIVTTGPGGPAIVPLDGGVARPIAGLDRDDLPLQWTTDHRSLYVQAPGDCPLNVFRLDLSTGRKQFWRSFMPDDPAGVVSVGPLLLTQDGRSYVYRYLRLLSDLYLVDGLK